MAILKMFENNFWHYPLQSEASKELKIWLKKNIHSPRYMVQRYGVKKFDTLK